MRDHPEVIRCSIYVIFEVKHDVVIVTGVKGHYRHEDIQASRNRKPCETRNSPNGPLILYCIECFVYVPVLKN